MLEKPHRGTRVRGSKSKEQEEELEHRVLEKPHQGDRGQGTGAGGTTLGEH